MIERTLVKICGTTSVADALLAQSAGADYLGVIVEHAPSPRSVSFVGAQAIFTATGLPTFAVTVNRSLDDLLRLADLLQPAALQLHGDESTQLVRDLKSHGQAVWVACSGSAAEVSRRALEVSEAGADAVLLDARAVTPEGVIYGGTGHVSDWDCAAQLVERGLRVVLAGGLSAENVAAAIEKVSPWMVDVVSGVEAHKGVKDAAKVRHFIEEAKRQALFASESKI